MTFDAQAWQQASTDREDTEAPDPGLYDVALDDAKAFTSKAGNAVIVVEFRVVAGQNMGHRWSDVRGLQSEGAVKAAKAMCSRLGIRVDEVTSLDDIDTALKTLKGRYFEVEVVQNGEYRNSYVQGPATSSSSDIPTPDDVADARQAAADDDVPF